MPTCVVAPLCCPCRIEESREALLGCLRSREVLLHMLDRAKHQVIEEEKAVRDMQDVLAGGFSW